MSKRPTLGVVLLSLLVATDVDASDLPKEWHGVWVGQLTVHGPTGKTFQRPWEIRIEPLTNRSGVTWRITSGMGGQTTTRNYELLPDAGKPGDFKVDEKNGILIDARLMGHGLYSYYKDGDILICTRFELRGDSLWVELASVSLKDPRISTLKEDMIEIQSYRLGSVQSGELKRKKASS